MADKTNKKASKKEGLEGIRRLAKAYFESKTKSINIHTFAEEDGAVCHDIYHRRLRYSKFFSANPDPQRTGEQLYCGEGKTVDEIYLDMFDMTYDSNVDKMGIVPGDSEEVIERLKHINTMYPSTLDIELTHLRKTDIVKKWKYIAFEFLMARDCVVDLSKLGPKLGFNKQTLRNRIRKGNEFMKVGPNRFQYIGEDTSFYGIMRGIRKSSEVTAAFYEDNKLRKKRKAETKPEPTAAPPAKPMDDWSKDIRVVTPEEEFSLSVIKVIEALQTTVDQLRVEVAALRKEGARRGAVDLRTNKMMVNICEDLDIQPVT